MRCFLAHLLTGHWPNGGSVLLKPALRPARGAEPAGAHVPPGDGEHLPGHVRRAVSLPPGESAGSNSAPAPPRTPRHLPTIMFFLERCLLSSKSRETKKMGVQLVELDSEYTHYKLQTTVTIFDVL